MGGIFGGLGISASGMTAERLRMDVIAENLANADTTRGADGKPYRRKEVLLQAAGGSFQDALDGVQVTGISQDPSPLRRVYDPGHPDADAQGYVEMPNVEPVTEMVDLITASRGYEANVQALQASKQMLVKTLDILR
jgi:flagellar basal-body rod protein FlgC